MRKVSFLICFLFSQLLVFGQDTTTKVPQPFYPYPKPFVSGYQSNTIDSSGFFTPRLMQPAVGIGPSVLTFYGDVSEGTFKAPSISRMGFNVSVSEYLKRYLLLSARAMFGKVGASERGPRFTNFESTIRSGGILLTYNFDNLLPEKRRVDPFITTGFEYFEFLSKTDMFDASGNQYHYWSDGSLMSLDENDPNGINAVPLIRDYSFETDIRKWNGSLFGKYPERSFAVPVGAGVNLHLAPRVDFKLGATMHFTFTDYIDGTTEANKGAGKGDSKHDNFLESYFTLTFDLFNPTPPFVSPLSDDEFLALENEDTDGDGVTDFNDSCQGTPPGVPVNAHGCPADSDGDRFPDYADKEVNSPPGALVDDFGVAMDDSTIAKKWREWSDTMNLYVDYAYVTLPTAVAGEASSTPRPRESTVVYRRELVILLGSYKEGVPPSEMGKLLSVPDVKSTMMPDSSTSYIAGSYAKKTDAEKRRDDLKANGFPDAKVMVLNKDGSLSEPTADIMAGYIKDGTVKDGTIKDHNTVTPPPVDSKGVVYRVQLGAFSRKLSSSIFKNAGQLVELKTEDGLYKYMSGSYPSVQDALKQRDELLKKGYKDAFVVAYKDSKRIPLSTATGGIVQPKNENIDESVTPKAAVDKSLISFRIQVGAFVNDPPKDIQDKLSKIPGLEVKRKASGVNQYLAGRFNNYEEAKKFRDEVSVKYGIEGAFMVAFFKDELISVQEAIELLK